MKQKRSERAPTRGRTGASWGESGVADDFLTDTSGTSPRAVASEQTESLGDRVRHARELLGLSLDEVGRRTAMKSSTLARVESNEVIPRLGELVRLGKALETNMGYLISPGVYKPMTVVRSDRRQPVARPKGRRGGEVGDYYYESLAYDKAGRLMEPFMVTLLPTKSQRTSVHDGQEFLYILEGQVLVRVGDESEVLDPGDAVYYDSSQPHSVESVGGSEARVLAVLSAGWGSR
jgi:mannose-6-phosphate isomerase-like protein (cupin superfamily)